jgi:hypothetical protein
MVHKPDFFYHIHSKDLFLEETAIQTKFRNLCKTFKKAFEQCITMNKRQCENFKKSSTKEAPLNKYMSAKASLSS